MSDLAMPDLTLIIGNKNYSSWSLRPWIFLKQNNIAFTEKRISLSTETTQQDLSNYGSDSKVPVLQEGDLIIWDSLAILEFISEKYLAGGGWPKDEKARAIARSICAEMHSSFSNLRNQMPMNCRKKFQDFSPSAETQTEIDRIQMLWQKCSSEFSQDGEWLFGEYCIVDAMFAPVALRFDGYDIPLRDVAASYVQTQLSQPAMLEWVEAGKLETETIAVNEV